MAKRKINTQKPPRKNGAGNIKSIKHIEIETDFVPVQIKDHKDYNGGHPHAIMDDIDDKHVSVGFSTQKKKGKNGGNNYTMEKSPLNDGKHSYMRRQAIVAPTTEYEKPRQGAMTPKDYERAKQYAEKAKQKYIDRKNGKKK